MVSLLLLCALVCLSSSYGVDEVDKSGDLATGHNQHVHRGEHDHDSIPQGHYGVVFDAGSSGTRVRVYHYDEAPDTPLGFINVREVVDSFKVRPGISEYVNNISGIPAYLKPLKDYAMSAVPAVERAVTPIFFMATAGMRFQTRTDTNNVMDKIAQLMRNKNFNPFKFMNDNVQVISGEEEAVYAWVALNYLTGFWDTVKPANQTAGVFEMGGGSTQIAFIPQFQAYGNEYSVVLGKIKYDLNAHSYLDFGINGIQRQIAERLALKGTMENPCLLVDDMKVYKSDNGTDLVNFGSGQPMECIEILSSIVNLAPGMEFKCQPKPCSVGTNYQPKLPTYMPFCAIGGFRFAPSGLGVLQPNASLSTMALVAAGYDYCQKTHSEAIEMGQKAEFASNTCVMSLFTPMLLDAYGVTDTTDLRVMSKVNGRSVDWTLGAFIVDTSEKLSGIRSAMSLRR